MYKLYDIISGKVNYLPILLLPHSQNPSFCFINNMFFLSRNKWGVCWNSGRRQTQQLLPIRIPIVFSVIVLPGRTSLFVFLYRNIFIDNCCHKSGNTELNKIEIHKPADDLHPFIAHTSIMHQSTRDGILCRLTGFKLRSIHKKWSPEKLFSPPLSQFHTGFDHFSLYYRLRCPVGKTC